MWQILWRRCSPQVFNHQECFWGIALMAGQAGVYRWGKASGEAGVAGRHLRRASKSGQAPKKISSLISHLCYFLSVSPQKALLLCSAQWGLMGNLEHFPSASLPCGWTSSLKPTPHFSGLMGIHIATQRGKHLNTFLSMKILYPRDERKTC